MSMKLSNIKYDKYSRSYSRTGRKKGYKVEIAYSDAHKYYYFLIEKKDTDYIFNSLWHYDGFKTEEECIAICEEYIDNNLKK